MDSVKFNQFLKGSNDALVALRLKICHENRCGQYHARTGTCSICGCGLADKTRTPGNHCPATPSLW